MRAEAAPDHHGSHRHLISEYDDLPDDAPRPVHAIVVPTIRHPRWLRHAARLAQHLSCPLVSLHSRNWSNAELADAVVPSAVHLIAIDIDDVGALNLPDFATDALLRNTPFVRFTDLSAKRNLGLALARMMDWQRIVFLDDDIEVGAPHEVSRAASLLDIYDVVGMRIGGYPDNSVVCHAYRETGGSQDSFVGGGALAVETTRNFSFFPNVYNEDWFYLLGDKTVRPLAVTGMVRQRPYDPFDRPIRARDQEFGDVLAEGVYWLLDERPEHGWSVAADRGHWERFLARRRDFVEGVLRRVRESPETVPFDRKAAEASLQAALGRLSRIEPEFCVAYLEAWLEDRVRWEKHLSGLPKHLPSFADAVEYLVGEGKPGLRWKHRVPDNL
ncbi:hypothetical protein GCM10009555_071990 [Acrocarpospora macrocephala]|uniref:Glycosyltransferase 2-like domain-containing protein n=1 Tax=Acrocarpospora macrocephala TaxID=150177 RepID=A0A5M3WHP7_9ACTN|nr:hypothetical protein [Acrocarpospora macrocephala]GES08655.1 hypothetical protein Amac_022510 [Acrocarpospora macrocephala]